MLERYIETTKDGSKTIFVPSLDENYHSVHGALQESLHVFIDGGLRYFDSTNLSSIKVLEMGYGTGLNAYLTYAFAQQNKVRIDYIGIEKYPVEADLFSGLNYSELMKEQIKTYELMDCTAFHKLPSDVKNFVSEYFSLEKMKIDIRDYQTTEVDLIYYDAFAPSAQENLWTEEIFAQMHSFLKPSGALVTYCAKGSVKRALRSVGFEVQSLPGPPGKREMTRAIKHE